MPSKHKPVYDFKMQPNAFAVSLTEGWRGEICHSAITDDQGEIMHYKNKRPFISQLDGIGAGSPGPGNFRFPGL